MSLYARRGLHEFRMDAEWAIEVLDEQPDTAPAVHAAVIRTLVAHGFICTPEYSMNPHGTWGRIDILAEKWGFKIAIEIDSRAPKYGSIRKLLAFDGPRILCLRGVEWMDETLPITFIRVPVRGATDAERADKRAVRRMMEQIRGQA